MNSQDSHKEDQDDLAIPQRLVHDQKFLQSFRNTGSLICLIGLIIAHSLELTFQYLITVPLFFLALYLFIKDASKQARRALEAIQVGQAVRATIKIIQARDSEEAPRLEVVLDTGETWMIDVNIGERSLDHHKQASIHSGVAYLDPVFQKPMALKIGNRWTWDLFASTRVFDTSHQKHLEKDPH